MLNQLRAKILCCVFINVCIVACFKSYCDDVEAQSKDKDNIGLFPDKLPKGVFPIIFMMRVFLEFSQEIYFLNLELRQGGGSFFQNPPGVNVWGGDEPIDELDHKK